MTSDPDLKDSPLPDDDRLARAFSLTERLMGGPPGDADARPEPVKEAGKSLRYWLWRAGGRKRPGGDAGHVAENYERELARLSETLRSQGEKALARERARVAELEKLTGQLQQAYQAELAKLRPAAPGEIERLTARCAEAEDRARLAENKVEMLKEALEITRARAGSGPCSPADDRFRETKRAFARMFHPDHGGRDAPDRAQAFLEFWPVLERIERGE